ncbi:Fanconi anemia group D2 protein homolog isoform X1 [Amborella trichopoda]|uniref:Fanconi anemia group D2 protein homolog isoform X1 n=1 Tax=Amborella trichopoda TaxID=13333 RepID=UPI0009C11D62|nr:Fanconi anemia group D2 protein homolog isoform X1 [Amborella trichopoda]|eukprot:XP_020518624.1 Fanconi anemia group D2 protein homolog isoform X1 [Amborella trichopoda]
MVFLQRSSGRKRPDTALAGDSHNSLPPTNDNKNKKNRVSNEGEVPVSEEEAMVALLAEAGCTLCNSGGGLPLVPNDIHKLHKHLEARFSSDPNLIPQFLSGFASYINAPHNLKRVLTSLPRTEIEHSSSFNSSNSDSLVRILLLVPPIQLGLQHMLLEKLPEYFGMESALLKDDIARLIISQFCWLDFLVDPKGFADKLMEVLSICPLSLKKDIIGSLPEMLGDKTNEAVVATLEQMLQEDSDVIVPVLDAFSNLNLNATLQEEVVTIALSCIRTVSMEHLSHLLRFLLLSATPTNVRRIISQIREHLKFVGIPDPNATRQKKLKGKMIADGVEVSILEALKSGLRFKDILCDAFLKVIKSLDNAREHKVIDVWLLMVIYTNGGLLQKTVEKIIKRKVIDGCFGESVFYRCIHGQGMIVQDYFSSFLSIGEFLMTCKEQRAREFGIYIYVTLFEEFMDAYSRQEVLGSLITHMGSGIIYEVNAALETMMVLTSKYPQDLVSISSHINGILDYLEGFSDGHVHKVYEIFSRLALLAHPNSDIRNSSIANDLLMIVRKQVGNGDLKYKRMGIIGILKIVSSLGEITTSNLISSTQKTNSQEALELLKMALDSCRLLPLPLVLLYDELVGLLKCTNLQATIMEWLCKHVGEFESIFLLDLEGGQLSIKTDKCSGLDGELWMNLDGEVSPICLNVLQLLSSTSQRFSSSLQFLPANFLLLSAVERFTNQGSLGGIDALLGCPLYLPSLKYFKGAAWRSLMIKQKQIVCLSLYYAINWIRELLNAFSTQVAGRTDSVTQVTRDEIATKLLKRLRNLVFLESLLNACLKSCPISLPVLHSSMEHSGHSLYGKYYHLQSKVNQDETKIVSDKNGKKQTKKKSAVSQVSDVDSRLKQPTILDSFKRAGITISQQASKECSSTNASKESTTEDGESQNFDFNELTHLQTSAAPMVLDAQRFKFRPLLVNCLSVLSLSKAKGSCCSDPAAELGLHLYLVRDFNYKLEFESPRNKSFFTVLSPNCKAPSGLNGLSIIEFMNKMRPLFSSLKKHLDGAVCVLKEGNDSCGEHWKNECKSAGNPDISYEMVSRSSVAGSIFKEILCCYAKILSFDDLCSKMNVSILRDLLEALQPAGIPDEFFSDIQPLPSSGSLEYLYCGAYAFLDGVLNLACSFSFLLATEVLVTLKSLVSSTQLLLEKSSEGNVKNCIESLPSIIPVLSRRLGTCAQRLLAHEWDAEDLEKDSKSKGETIQNILQIYLDYSDCTFDLVNELACKIIPQVPSGKSRTGQDYVSSFPTLSPGVLAVWYRVLHEQNIANLKKLIREIGTQQKSRTIVGGEAIERSLAKARQSVDVIVSLVNMCKTHDKVFVHAMAVRYTGRFVDSFLKVFDFLKVHFDAHSDTIIQMFKELQKATRTIQFLCSDAKGSKRTMITSKIPTVKRSMERFLFQVKALFHNVSNGCSFWMGNLKHKDLLGQVVSSQVHADRDDENEEGHDEMEDVRGQGMADNVSEETE